MLSPSVLQMFYSLTVVQTFTPNSCDFWSTYSSSSNTKLKLAPSVPSNTAYNYEFLVSCPIARADPEVLTQHPQYET